MDILLNLMRDYKLQANYPIAQFIILQRIDKKVTKLEVTQPKIREAVKYLLFAI